MDIIKSKSTTSKILHPKKTVSKTDSLVALPLTMHNADVKQGVYALKLDQDTMNLM